MLDGDDVEELPEMSSYRDSLFIKQTGFYPIMGEKGPGMFYLGKNYEQAYILK